MQEVTIIKKEGKIAFGSTKYNFIADDDLTPLIRERMVAKGIIMFPTQSESQVIEAKGNILTVTQQYFKFLDTEDDSSITVCTVGQGYDTADKGSGKSMTNSRKYAILQTFMLTGDDPDNTASDSYHKPTVTTLPKAPVQTPTTPTVPEPESGHTIGFGKYKGQYLEDIVMTDRNYVEYLSKNQGQLQQIALDLLALPV